jgi:hypothetical protein
VKIKHHGYAFQRLPRKRSSDWRVVFLSKALDNAATFASQPDASDVEVKKSAKTRTPQNQTPRSAAYSLNSLRVRRVVFLSKAPVNEAAPASSNFTPDDWKQSMETQKLSQQPAPLAQNKKNNLKLRNQTKQITAILAQNRAKTRTPQNQTPRSAAYSLDRSRV